MISEKDASYIPARQTVGSAGYDVRTPEAVMIIPGDWVTIDTGVRLTDDDVTVDAAGRYCDRWFAMLVPRSGLASRYGLRLRNTVGIIDRDFRGTIKATVTVDEMLLLAEGERFAQMIFVPYLRLAGEDPPERIRGEGGYGSTGGA